MTVIALAGGNLTNIWVEMRHLGDEDADMYMIEAIWGVTMNSGRKWDENHLRIIWLTDGVCHVWSQKKRRKGESGGKPWAKTWARG